MKRTVGLITALLLAAPAFAGKTYQATGEVVDVSPTSIVIDKGKEGKWEIARDAATKVTGDAKKGSKATVEYKMVAVSIESKDKPKADAKGEAKGKEKNTDKGKGEAKGKDKPAGVPAAK